MSGSTDDAGDLPPMSDNAAVDTAPVPTSDHAAVDTAPPPMSDHAADAAPRRPRRSTWALVPAKGFDRGKSRLAPALSDGARAAFARQLFDHVVATLTAAGVLDGVLVATDAPEVAAAARAHGAEVRMDAGATTTPRPLANVIDAGLHDLAARGAEAALVLMADLPRLGVDDVRALVAALDAHDVVAVLADDGCHTNALGLAPPTRLPTAFGRADSFAAHVAAARASGARLALVDNPHIAFDVDGPADHERLLRMG
jgi:2-phospho-L-lactate/phosphoenolpyruvate guanylyltransferase